MTRVFLVEPFYGGSHKQLVDFLMDRVLNNKDKHIVKLATMTAKKFPWRSRTSALHLAQNCDPEKGAQVDVLFCSSVLNLAEFLALRSDLRVGRKIVYFHENQLCYPVRETKERDFQHGYNQVLSCLVADQVVFNSEFNKESFLSSINRHMKLMPDYR